MIRICFFVRLKDPALLDVVDFYQNDIRALRELGFHVETATRFRDIRWDADVYFTWWWGSGALSLVASVLRRRPNIFTGTLQLTPEVGWWQNLGAVRRGVVRACIQLASANIAICGVELKYLQRLGGERLHLVPQGIDVERYCPPPNGAVREKVILTVSHLTRTNAVRKRLATVIRAAPHVLAQHPDARFVMIGGHEDAYLDLLALARSLRVAHAVTFPGRVSTEEKISYYQGASVLAQATIYEGFGVSIAEAMACGLPVVTSPKGAVPEVVGDCGRFVAPDDAEGMAHEISALLADPAAAAKLGERARARVVERYSYLAHKAALARVLSQVIPSWTLPEGA